MARKAFTTTLDETLQKEFKKACAANDEKMNNVIEAFFQAYINGEFFVERKVAFELKRVAK